jgi:hypothetical protein
MGAAVPHQVQLRKLPGQVPAVMQGYQGDDYIVVSSS